MACFLDCGRLFSGLPVMAHKGVAPAAVEIRTGQSGVTTVHLKTCQAESLALLIWPLQKLEPGYERKVICFFFPSPQLT